MGRQGEIRAAKNASRKLDADGKALQNAVDNITSAVDNMNTTTSDDYDEDNEINMKQRIINKATRYYKVAPQDKDLAGALNRVAKEIRKDPITVRKQSTGSGNLSIMR